MSKHSLTICRISFESLVQIVGRAVVCTVFPAFLVATLFAVFGYSLFSFQQHPIVGWPALFIGPFYGLICCAFLSLFATTMTWLGLRLYGLFGTVELEVWTKEEKAEPAE